jgi:hypothetical protein
VTARVKHRLAVTTLMAFVVALAAPAASAQSAATLVPATSDGTELNVTIPVFDPGIPDDPSQFRDLQVFPRIRQIEAKLMPFLLRDTLVESEQWGAVRVATIPDTAAELQLLGTIVRSDGERLDLRIRAVDATGNTWFDRVFSSQANEESVAEPGDKGTPEFQSIYTEIAAELAATRDLIGDAAISNIKGTSLMRYATELAPTAFSGYLEQSDDGTFRLLRLPARDNPMLIRIETIRNTEFLITDTVDAKFREFNADLARTYRFWREYRRKALGYDEWNVNFAEAKPEDVGRGSWESIQHQYDAYKYDRVSVQEQDRLAVAFNNEVISTVDAMETRVAELDGWVEQGSQEWNSLLEELYEVEMRLLEQGN